MGVRLLYFCRRVTYIGLLGLPSFFSDARIFKYLMLFWLFGLGEILFDFHSTKCVVYQIAGKIKLKLFIKDSAKDIASYESQVKYDLPFDDAWVVVNGCYTKEFSHSWGVPSQRYAYDFLIIDEEGKSYKNDPTVVEDYYCYGLPLKAPADGVIMEVVNDAKESTLYGKGRYINRAKHLAGNYIIIQHEHQELTMLAHLKKDSVLVEVGDTVKRGQVVARCGNTGNSSEPHLHFQLQNRKSFYSSSGLPITFNDLEITTHPNYARLDSRPTMDIKKIKPSKLTRGYRVSNRVKSMAQ